MSILSMKHINSLVPAHYRNGAVLAVITILTFIVIASYSPLDPAWSRASNHQTVQNVFGVFGATIADLLNVAFGYVRWSIPFVLLLKIVCVFTTKEKPHWRHTFTSIAGFLVMVMSLACLASLWHGDSDVAAYQSGGKVGLVITNLSLPHIPWIAVAYLALASLLIGVQMVIRHSWLAFFEVCGQAVYEFSVSSYRFVGKQIGSSHALEDVPPTNRTSRRTKKSTNQPTLTSRSEPRVEPKNKKRIETATESSNNAADVSVDRKITSLPDFSVLSDVPKRSSNSKSAQSIHRVGEELAEKLLDFNVSAKVTSIVSGPVVTRFEIQLAPGIKVSKVAGLALDLARELAVSSVRIVDLIEGKSVVGIEIPNDERSIVHLKEVLEQTDKNLFSSPLTFALGKNVAGEPVTADLEKMPHLLMAGTTGSGKSVCINVMLLSLLLNTSPDDVRLILIDPKLLELAMYQDIPHLLTPVVTDMEQAPLALNWCIAEMERRYQLMAALGVRNLRGYNNLVVAAMEGGDAVVDPLYEGYEENAPTLDPLPLIVVVVDELADLMMMFGKKVEQLIARLAQKARAAGIHLILATQRPSVDVITGLIKANVPCRISFQVASKFDSRTVLDQDGAEHLLGNGDMLFQPPGSGRPERVHGAFIADSDVISVTDAWREQGVPQYVEDVTSGDVQPTPGTVFSFEETRDKDEYYDEAVKFVYESGKVSASSIQRRFTVGYNRAANIVERMEAEGIASPPGTNGQRTLLAPKRE